MDKIALNKLRFPIGKYAPGDDFGMDEVESWINDIRILPNEIERITKGISEEDSEKNYRPGSWTVRQVVHHVVSFNLL